MSLIEVTFENLELYKNINLVPGKIYFRKTNDSTISNHYIPFSINHNSKNKKVRVGNLLMRNTSNTSNTVNKTTYKPISLNRNALKLLSFKMKKNNGSWIPITLNFEKNSNSKLKIITNSTLSKNIILNQLKKM